MATLDLFYKLKKVIYKSVILESIKSQTRAKHCNSLMDFKNEVTEIKFDSLNKSDQLPALRMTYTQSGKQKFRDILSLPDRVVILVYNITRKIFIFNKKFRPGVYFISVPKEKRFSNIDIQKYSIKLGITTELCTGLIDKTQSLTENAQKTLKECGYIVSNDKFERIHFFTANIGVSGPILSAFYCEVTDNMKVPLGDSIKKKHTEVVEMNWNEFERYASKSKIRSPGSFLIAYYWFICNKPQHYNILKLKN